MSVTTDPRRFGGLARLYGEEGLMRLTRASVCVVGLGGVGSWAVEALARSGVGALHLVDGDTVALSNTNRQLHALGDGYGKPKAEELAARVRAINPDCRVTTAVSFVAAHNVADLVPEQADWVLDCIDDLNGKTALVALVKSRGQRLVCSGGAGAKTDPSRVRTDDMARVKGDPLIGKLRTRLRKEHGFAQGRADGKSAKFGIPTVYSDEPVRQPTQENNEAIGAGPDERIGFGSCVAVTASAGLRLAGLVINELAGGKMGE